MKKFSGGNNTESISLISERYSHLLDSLEVMPGSAYWKDKNGVYLGYNDAILKIANVNELKGKTDFDLPWKEEAPTIIKTDKEVINSNKTLEFEEIFTLADGQRATMLTKKTPLHDLEGNVVGILGVSINVTKQRSNENPEQIALDNIIATMPGHVYWKDTKGIYLGCNNRQAQSLGFSSSSEVVGKTDFDIQENELARGVRQNDIRIIETGQTEIIEEKTKIDGIEVLVLSQKSPLRDRFGQILGVLGISLDITARKIEEEKCRQEKEKAEFTLAYIIEHLPGHVYWKNRDSVYQGCNLAQAKSAGCTNISEMIGRTDYEMPWSNEADILRQSDLMVMTTKQELIREEISKIAQFEEISTFLSRKVPFLNKKGEVIGILGVSFDITDRKKMEVALKGMLAAEAASRAKSEFIANISHDLRTPLTGIVTMSNALKDKLRGIEGEQEAQWLQESGEQLLEFCNNILDFITADNYTEQNIEEECFDLRQLIQAVVQLEMPMVKSKALNFFVDIDSPAPSYLIKDKKKLYRVLVNLLGNSIKFTEKGHIRIEVKLIQSNKDNVILKFSVADTGIGVKSELQEKIFDRFFRANPSYKGTYKGNGLGLYIAQKYVQLLGGERIYVESEEGKGCCFFFTLSFKLGNQKDVVNTVIEQQQKHQDVRQSPSRAISETSQLIDDSSQPCLLIIEDNKPALRGLEAMIKKAGCRFKSAEDGEKGVQLATTHDFALIISDIGLPGISGIEATKAIRAWEKENNKKRVPIIALTGHAAQVAEPECLRAGMDKVLTKPANLDTIKNLIQQFISKNEGFGHNIPPQLKSSRVKLGLGLDLPDTEEGLFKLEQYLYFDMKVMQEIYGDNCEKFIKTFLETLSSQLPKDKEEIAEAFRVKDWNHVEKLAHKTKGGAACSGTLRMKYASQYLERYSKAGHSKSLEKLYFQLMQVMDETKKHVDDWLKLHSET